MIYILGSNEFTSYFLYFFMNLHYSLVNSLGRHYEWHGSFRPGLLIFDGPAILCHISNIST